MAQSVIGALRVNLGLDSAQFTRGAQRVKGPLNELRSQFMRVTAAVTAAGSALGALTIATGNAAREISRLSGVANAPLETFQQWAAASQTVGIEQEKLADILKDTNDRVGDFLQTGGGPMADFFENIAPKVGVTAEQFAKLSGPEALQLYVTSLERAGASQQEMTFYMEALASDATLLLPLLRNNGEAMNVLGQRASDLGAVMDRDAITAFQRMNIAIGGIGEVFTGLRNRIAQEVEPAITSMANAFTNAFRTGGVFRGMIDTLISNLDRLTTYAVTAVAVFGTRLVAAFVAARVAAMTFGGSLLFIRGALIRTGIGALIVGLGELVFWFTKLVKGAGGVGAAFGLLADVAVEVWERITDRFRAMLYSVMGGWDGIKSAAYLALQGVVDRAYEGVNNIIGAFVGAKDAIVATWRMIPSAIGDLVFQAANRVIEGLESMLNGAITRIDAFTGKIRGALEAVGIETAFGEIGEIDLGGITNPFAGQAEAAGRQIAEAFANAMSQNYTGDTPQGFAGLAAEAAISQAQFEQMADTFRELSRQPLRSVEAIKEAMRQAGEEAGLTGEQTDAVADSLANVATQLTNVGDTAPGIGKVTQAVESMETVMQNIGRATAATFANIVTGAANAKDAVGQLLGQIANMIAQRAFMQLFSNFGLFGFANGTPYAPGGLALVGERGPELVNLPRGSQVSNSQATRQMMSGGGETAVRIDLGPDLEARILSQSNANAVKIVQDQTPTIVRRSVAAVGDTNRETGNYLGRTR